MEHLHGPHHFHARSAINDKLFDHRPVDQLMAIVKNDLRKFDQEGLIDEGVLIKTVKYCNEKLGIPIREVREIAIPVYDFKAKLPADFERLYYVCALNATNTLIHYNQSPFDNNFDADIVYDAHLDRESLGNAANYRVVIQKETNISVHNFGHWVHLDVGKGGDKYCHIGCPNLKHDRPFHRGRYTVELDGEHIHTPFRAGILFLVYIGMMKDANGNITFPFHPLITPFYEWSLKEKILSDAIFNSDIPNIGELFKLAQLERGKAWLEAFNFTTEKEYGGYVDLQRKKELKWYNEYFKYFQFPYWVNGSV